MARAAVSIGLQLPKGSLLEAFGNIMGNEGLRLPKGFDATPPEGEIGVEQGNESVANAIAQKRQVFVAGILTPGLPLTHKPGLDGIPCSADKGTKDGLIA